MTTCRFSFRLLPRVALTILFVVLGHIGAFAKTVQVPGTDASIDLPDDWTIQPRDEAKLYAVANDRSGSIAIATFENLENESAYDAKFFQNLQAVMAHRASAQHASVKVFDQKTTEIGGIPAAFIQSEIAFSPGGAAYGRNYAIGVDKTIFVIMLLSPDPSASLKLDQIASTLRFSQPHGIPGVSLWSLYWQDILAVVALIFALIAWFRLRRSKQD